jgi:hypothetical protein
LAPRHHALGPRAARESAIAWAGEGGHVAEKQSLGAALLGAARAELEARGLRWFVLVFHARASLSTPEGEAWQERFLLAELARQRIPYVSSRTALEADMQKTGAAPESYFHASGFGANHYTAAADAVVFAALQAGLEGRFEGER